MGWVIWALILPCNITLYSDGVVLEVSLRQWATKQAIWQISSQDFFHPPYPHLIRKPTLSNIIFPFHCAVARHPHVSQKMSDVNDVELPLLGGTVTLWSHGSWSACNIFSCKSCQSSTLIPTLSPSLLPVTQLKPILLFFLTFWIVYTLTWISWTLLSVTASVTHGHEEISACLFQAWIQL